MEMPLSEDALRFARKLASKKYTYPDDRLAVATCWSGGIWTGFNGDGAPDGVAVLP